MTKLDVTKQVVGIDIAKDSFYACYKIESIDKKVVIKGTKSFDNTASGFSEFYEWCNKRNKKNDTDLLFIMEATGVYHEELAYFLYNNGNIVSVQLPQKIKYFAKSCNVNTKTDKNDSKIIARFGIEKHLDGLDLWSPPSKKFKLIRDLTREHASLKKALTALLSQLHALKYAYESNDEVIESKNQQISFYKTQIQIIEKKIKKHVELDSELNSKVKKIMTIKGLGLITIIKIITETNGFQLFTNIRKLVSYAGLDIIESESGKIVGKTKISKKGNVRIRSALYMPALSAIQHNGELKTFYERVEEGRSAKRQAVVAVMRKLLILIYTLWKKDEEYIENYQASKQSDCKVGK